MRVISDHELSRAILASRAFGVFPMADIYKELSARYGHDFASSIAVLEGLPIFLDGEPHGAVRQAMARVFGVIRQPQLAVAKEFLAEFGAAMLQPGKSFDLMDDFSRPLFRAMTMVALTASDLPDGVLDLIDEIPLLFSPLTALKQRLAINARIAALVEQHGTERLCDIGLMVLGVRPLTGTLAWSLHATISSHQGNLLSAMAWPTRITMSSVTYIDRMCLEPVTLDEESFATGEHLRCMIQLPAWSAEQRQATMFGVGSHLCLGRPISEQVWAQCVELFAAQELRASAGPLTMSPGNEPFDLPAHCPISIEA